MKCWKCPPLVSGDITYPFGGPGICDLCRRPLNGGTGGRVVYFSHRCDPTCAQYPTCPKYNKCNLQIEWVKTNPNEGGGGGGCSNKREDPKWISLYNEKLKELVDKKGFTKSVLKDEPAGGAGGGNRNASLYKDVDAMPDHIKEAEEYADKLYSALR